MTQTSYYPAYSGQQQAYRTKPGSPVVKVDGAYPVPKNNEAALKHRVSKQPTIVDIKASKSFQHNKEVT
ncbi:hypothetical protein E2562_008837 [Oryza meyeriana var. granulata]|uniref:Uncharacterized protein n=1 Tax=Oryza meyeriana var. granulata TaxID=110450 RepID=A0A6G1D0T8_9ORYZ|nr:hypothetical protein E2562_008837 [Oryza meyeriana var. granulata]